MAARAQPPIARVGTGADAIPRAVGAIESGIREGLHLGAQLYVSKAGRTVADLGVGEARTGVPMTPDSMITWFSMTKPSVVVSVAQLWERGLVDLDDPVARYVPEFAAEGKEAVTLRHLLTHTAGIRGADLVSSDLAGDAYWDEVIAITCAVELDDGWVPGRRAGYHLTAGMTMLAEVVRRVDGRRFERYVREEVFEPLGMDDCWVGMPPDRHAEYGERIGTMHSTALGAPVPLVALDTPEFLARCIPGGGGRGPMRQLARLYEALVAGGELDGVRVLARPTVEALTARHRVGMFDETYHVVCDWGLGFAVDAYAFGRHASPRAYGHGGALSSVGMADPEHALVAVVQTNGMCANDDHYRRLSEILTELYVDVGVAEPDAVGRDKPMPAVDLTAPGSQDAVEEGRIRP